MSYWLNAFIALGCTVIAILLLKPVARQIGLVDHPGGRKQHHGTVPLVGGIGIFIGFFFSLLTLDVSLLPYRPLLAAMGLMVFVGVLDDFHELSASARLFTQLIAALIMVAWAKLRLYSFGDIIGIGAINLGNWSIMVSIIAMVAVINSINMLDGLDGLAAGVCFIQLGLMCWILLHGGYVHAAILLMLMLGSILGFLLFNFPWLPKIRAKIFLGDAGSMTLGLLLAWLSISITQTSHSVVSPVTMLWILMIPLYDLTASIIRRVIKGRSMFQPDRGHFHHVFLLAGYRPAVATYLICLLTAVFGVFGLLMYYHHVAEWVMFALFLILFIIYYWSVAHAWRLMKLLKIKKKRKLKFANRGG